MNGGQALTHGRHILTTEDFIKALPCLSLQGLAQVPTQEQVE